MGASAKTKIKQALAKVVAGDTFVVYTLGRDGRRYRRGWWYRLPGETAVYLGASVAEALKKISSLADIQEPVSA